ncbi:hypothetical protein V6N13_103667 [Hibiscus sabdariffa]
MVVLLETKLEEVTSRIVSRVWYTYNFEFAFSPSKGKAGGILIIWDTTCFHLRASELNPRFVLIDGVWIKEDWRCGIFGIYAPSGMAEQVCLWSSIGGLLASRQFPWCVCGDFNVVLKREERQGCVTTPTGMLEFNDFVETNGLVDLPIQGSRFTWFGPENKCSRIDRILVTSEWCVRFEQMVVMSLPRGLSDHRPLFFVNNCVDGGPRPFHFINAWLIDRHNVNLMAIEWQKLKDTTDHTDLLQRLRGLKGFLNGWNAKTFGNVDFHIQEVSKKIEELDNADPASVDLQQLLRVLTCFEYVSGLQIKLNFIHKCNDFALNFMDVAKLNE